MSHNDVWKTSFVPYVISETIKREELRSRNIVAPIKATKRIFSPHSIIDPCDPSFPRSRGDVLKTRLQLRDARKFPRARVSATCTYTSRSCTRSNDRVISLPTAGIKREATHTWTGLRECWLSSSHQRCIACLSRCREPARVQLRCCRAPYQLDLVQVDAVTCERPTGRFCASFSPATVYYTPRPKAKSNIRNATLGTGSRIGTGTGETHLTSRHRLKHVRAHDFASSWAIFEKDKAMRTARRRFEKRIVHQLEKKDGNVHEIQKYRFKNSTIYW